MSFQSVIGQPLAVDLSTQWLKKKTTNPLLFYGPDGVGKRTLALEIAKALNCAAPTSGGSCDRCGSCQKVKGGIHPDVRVVDMAWQALERDELLAKQQTIRMETILNQRRRLLQSAVEGEWKVLILDDAQRLTPDAANVLLKILEEPPEQTAIFLVTPFRDRLFATLVSRCQPVRFRPLSDEEMQECLSTLGIAPETRIRLLELALGSPGRALHLSRDEQIQTSREAETLWQSLAQKTPGTVLTKSEGRSKATKPGRSDFEAKVHALLIPAQRAVRSGSVEAVEAVTLLHRALQQLRQNVQPTLAYDNLLLQLNRQRVSSSSQTRGSIR